VCECVDFRPSAIEAAYRKERGDSGRRNVLCFTFAVQISANKVVHYISYMETLSEPDRALYVTYCLIIVVLR